MKNRSAFRKWFWDRPLFRRLRFRLISMILVLVLPLSILCITISTVAVVQEIDLTRTIEGNGLIAYMEKEEISWQIEGITEEEIPAAAARSASAMLPVVKAKDGSIYISMDGHETWLVNTDGSRSAASVSWDELMKTRYRFSWQSGVSHVRILVVFPFSFVLASIPVWFWFVTSFSLLTLIAVPLIYGRLKNDILIPMKTLETAMDTLKHDPSYRIPDQGERPPDEFLRLNEDFNAMAEEVQASYEKDLKMMESEMENLRLQVNPHMLLNSYNMIYALAESKNYPVIQDYTLCLVDYFRYVLRRGNELVTIQQELDFVENFIRIQRIRFPDRFSFVYQISEGCRSALIPPLLIENFVENATKYALKPEEAIEIVVSAHMEQEDSGEKQLHIAVTDTGSGIRPDVLAKLQNGEPYVDASGHRHIGVWNCIRRIELFYGQKGNVRFTSGEGHGTQVYITIPCIYEQPGREVEK